MKPEDQQPKGNVSEREFGSKKSKFEGIEVRQDTLPDSQDAQLKYVQDDVASIINRMLNIAKEICSLSEHKVPAESDSIDTMPHVLPR
ncbi:MAG: hypothetical protein K0R55_1532 [Sporomusa sp.]|jgi:hypothetical protein|nr:hypothetical protein [Sporomusa sp.]